MLAILPYKDEEEAVRIANDTVYGLSGYVQSSDIEHARRVAKRIRAGNVHLNGAGSDFAAAFGGYKQSGNGREWGEAGFEEFLELKCIFGYEPKYSTEETFEQFRAAVRPGPMGVLGLTK